MVVPKKRTTRAAQGRRRSHNALKPAQLINVGGNMITRRLKKAAELGLLKSNQKA